MNVSKMKKQEMVDYLEGHFRYYTLNSWNCLHSYARNVKLYNLNLPNGIEDKAYEIVFMEDSDFVWNTNEIMHDFGIEHPGYSVGFNGRSGGYIVLCQDGTNKGVDQDEDFSEWDCEQLRDRVRLLVDFNRMVDDIRNELIYFCE